MRDLSDNGRFLDTTIKTILRLQENLKFYAYISNMVFTLSWAKLLCTYACSQKILIMGVQALAFFDDACVSVTRAEVELDLSVLQSNSINA